MQTTNPWKMTTIGLVVAGAAAFAGPEAFAEASDSLRDVLAGLQTTTQQIRNKLFRDKRTDSMEAFVKTLRDKAKISIDESKLGKVQVEGVQPGQFPGPGVPPPMPGQFHPGAPGMPHGGPAQPGSAPGAPSITPPPPGSEKAPPTPAPPK